MHFEGTKIRTKNIDLNIFFIVFFSKSTFFACFQKSPYF